MRHPYIENLIRCTDALLLSLVNYHMLSRRNSYQQATTQCYRFCGQNTYIIRLEFQGLCCRICQWDSADGPTECGRWWTSAVHIQFCPQAVGKMYRVLIFCLFCFAQYSSLFVTCRNYDAPKYRYTHTSPFSTKSFTVSSTFSALEIPRILSSISRNWME